MKYLCLLLSLVSFTVVAHEGIQLRDGALKQLKNFKPETLLKDFSDNPKEAELHLEHNLDPEVLKQMGQNRASQDENVALVEAARQKNSPIAPNENAYEIKASEAYIGGAEENIFPNCHWERKPCDEVVEDKTCEEKTHYIEKTCESRIKPKIKVFEHPQPIRMLNTNVLHDLSKCSELRHEWYCQPQKLLQPHPNCHHLELEAITTGTYIQNGLKVDLLKKPSCQDPSFSLSPIFGRRRVAVILKLKEYLLEEETSKQEHCDFLHDKLCRFQRGQPCLDEGQTKLIDGFPLTRACWGESSTYQCVVGQESNCEPLLTEDCTNLESKCLSEFNAACEHLLRTFRCTQRTCYPDKKVCSGTIPCADGSCDESKSEESHDIDQGISRLGALSGSAEEVALHQAQNHTPTLFRGEKFECEAYPLGLRDCCTDSGFLDGLIHCPRELQDFQKAKLEGRVAWVGSYKDMFYETKKFVYCIFPSKLGGILQIQGRQAQLGISFGEAKNPNCRGMSPQELERINFSALDLSPMVNDLKSKISFQDQVALEEQVKSQVKARHEQRTAHD